MPAQNVRGYWVLISSTNSGISEGLESWSPKSYSRNLHVAAINLSHKSKTNKNKFGPPSPAEHTRTGSGVQAAALDGGTGKGATNTLSASTRTDGGCGATHTCGAGANSRGTVRVRCAFSNNRGTVHAPWCTDHTSYCANLCDRPFRRQWDLNIAAGKAGTDECGVVITVVECSTQGAVTIKTCNDSLATGTATVATIAS